MYGHALNKAVFQRINMLNHAVEQNLAFEISDDLVDSNGDVSRAVEVEGDWIDVRINHAPLPRPIRANALMTVNRSSFHAVGPLNVGLHGG